jgi:hypothetical protein
MSNLLCGNLLIGISVTYSQGDNSPNDDIPSHRGHEACLNGFQNSGKRPHPIEDAANDDLQVREKRSLQVTYYENRLEPKSTANPAQSTALPSRDLQGDYVDDGAEPSQLPIKGTREWTLILVQRGHLMANSTFRTGFLTLLGSVAL